MPGSLRQPSYRLNASLAYFSAALHLLVLTAVAGADPASKDTRLSTSAYVKAECSQYDDTHGLLVKASLAPYADGISAASVFNHTEWPPPGDLPGSLLWWRRTFGNATHPVAVVLDGSVQLHPLTTEDALVNGRYFFLPLLRTLSEIVKLPDLVLAMNPCDEPSESGSGFKGRTPWAGYCQVRRSSADILLPETLQEPWMKHGTHQVGAGDTREPRAVFLGSPTGWKRGRRRAVCLAGVLHPDQVYSGLSNFPTEETAMVDPKEVRQFQKPRMELQQQVDRFKYIVNVDGHCAALRLRNLLASDSAVMWVRSPEEEWYYDLLVPFMHYIPIDYNPTGRPYDAGLNLAEMVQWAEANPHLVAQIVKNANAFADFHLQPKGPTCYAVRLLHEYQKLLTDGNAVREYMSSTLHAHAHARLEGSES